MCVEDASLCVCMYVCVQAYVECEYLRECSCMCISSHPSHARGNQRTERMMSKEAGDMFLPWYPIQGKGKDVVPVSELYQSSGRCVIPGHGGYETWKGKCHRVVWVSAMAPKINPEKASGIDATQCPHVTVALLPITLERLEAICGHDTTGSCGFLPGPV